MRFEEADAPPPSLPLAPLLYAPDDIDRLAVRGPLGKGLQGGGVPLPHVVTGP